MIFFSNDHIYFLALQVLTLRTNIRNIKRVNNIDNLTDAGSFANFTATLAQDYMKSNILDDKTPMRVNSFVEGFHDSLILYAFAVAEVSKIINFQKISNNKKI